MSNAIPAIATGATTPASTGASTGTNTGASPQATQLHKAATQFEAIFLRQMLSAAHQTHFDTELFSSQGLDTFTGMQDERLADIAAGRDTLGLATTIEKALKARAATATGKGG